MKRPHNLIYTALAVACLMMAGCDHKELNYDMKHNVKLRLEFDWSDLPGVNPEGMAVFFYTTDIKGENVRYDFKGHEGGEIQLPAGEYHIMTYNNDASSTLARDVHDHFLHTLYTRDGSLFEPVGQAAPSRAPQAPGTENERVVICPDRMYGCTQTGITVDRNTGVITLKPSELTSVYTYEIRNVKNLQNATQVSLSLSGMAPHMAVHGEVKGDESVTLPFGGSINSDGTITGRFITFGHHESNADPHKMMLYVWTEDGSKFAFGSTDDNKMDVTDQVDNAPNQKRVHIVIDGLDIPPIDTGDSFEPSADDWTEVKVDIPM